MKIYIVIALAFILSSCGQKTYEDCLLENSKDISNHEAALLVAHACKKKYSTKSQFDPETAQCAYTRDLTDIELQLLNGRGEILNDHFKGTVHNGNKDIVISDITIGIQYNVPTDSDNPFNQFIDTSYKNFYNRVTISPNSVGDIFVKVLPRRDQFEKIDWRIISAKACR